MNTKIATKNVKLIGGPMNGQTVAIPKTAEVFIIGKPGVVFWIYNYAGTIDRHEMFAILPRSRQMRRFIFWYIGSQGKDPRVEESFAKEHPMTNTGRVAHGRGAMKRRAKRDQHPDA